MTPRAMGSKDKLRQFFLEHVGEVVDFDTLRAVAGSSEWARRLRELRDQEGMDIRSHRDDATMKPGQYCLASLKPRPIFAGAISKELRALVLARNGGIPSTFNISTCPTFQPW